MTLCPGDRVTFAEERQAYTVRAASERCAVCTKPFNARRTVIYTIVDFVEKVRGTENLIFCAGFETREDCEEALKRLTGQSGYVRAEVSHRNRIPLNIVRVRGPK